MQKHLFLCIDNDITNHDKYHKQHCNTTELLDISCLQKCMAALQMLVYGQEADSIDEHLCISESTILESLKWFCHAVSVETYLTKATLKDIKRLMAENKQEGFLGC